MRTALVVLALLFSCSTAFAAPAKLTGKQKTEARKHFNEGLAAYQRGDYNAAVDGYQQAYDISHAPALLFNLAQVYRIQGRYDEAIERYRQYLVDAPKAENRADAEQRIAEIEELQKKLTPPAPVEVAPAPEPTVPPAKPPEATAQAPTETEVPASPPAPVDTAPAGDRGAGLRQSGLITMGIGGALAVTTVVLLVMAHSDASTVTGAPSGTTWDSSYHSAYDSANLKQNIGIATGVAAGVAIAGGGVLYYLGVRAEHATVAYVPQTGGGGVVFGCDF